MTDIGPYYIFYFIIFIVVKGDDLHKREKVIGCANGVTVAQPETSKKMIETKGWGVGW